MCKLRIRQAKQEDMSQILQIYAYARTFMAETGNATQWADHFPPEELLAADMKKSQLYVVEKAGRIHGVFAFIIGNDSTYAVIEQGSWRSESAYGTIHRVAGDGEVHGIFEEIVSFCEKNIAHLRIDTHEDNKIMQHLIEKNGFVKCGIIHVADGSPRIAYEKLPDVD